MEKKIGFTKVALPYGWLGNMAPYPIEAEGTVWRTAEAFFQASRFSDSAIREAIRSNTSPFGAKLTAKANVEAMQIAPCSEQDVENMRTCLKLKLEQHPELVEELKATGSAIIFEDVKARGDRGSNLFWGAKEVDGELVGENVLGKLWMELRSSI